MRKLLLITASAAFVTLSGPAISMAGPAAPVGKAAASLVSCPPAAFGSTNFHCPGDPMPNPPAVAPRF